MRFEIHSNDCLASPCDALVIPISENWNSSPSTNALEQATQGWFRKVMESGEVSTKPNKVTSLIEPNGIPARILTLVGIGPESALNCNTYFRAAGAAMRALATKPRGRVRFAGFESSPLLVRAAITGAMVGAQGQDLFRTEKNTIAPEVIEWCGSNESQIWAGEAIGNAVNLARDLVNQPPNILYPESFVDRAKQVAELAGFSIEVWDKAKLESEKCGALLGVARGSVRPPALLILRYQGSSPDSQPLALIGKGVTFDSGGYSLKPTDSMLTMKCDMAGAATVLGIFQAAAKLRVRRNLVGVIGLVENLVSGDAFKLGDGPTRPNRKNNRNP